MVSARYLFAASRSPTNDASVLRRLGCCHAAPRPKTVCQGACEAHAVSAPAQPAALAFDGRTLAEPLVERMARRQWDACFENLKDVLEAQD